ncbi:uncharacterized protein G2W53_024266 [Senna tora]|uniref:Uncharacterized protein n=1 Tax=Senna tora TaxID=362788 RepID=A0A834WGT0_9FABA|nr:uncharacterized protein G2W53_024266 [Senna tora]
MTRNASMVDKEGDLKSRAYVVSL